MSTAFKTFDGQRLLDLDGKPILSDGYQSACLPESPDRADIEAKLFAGELVLEGVQYKPRAAGVTLASIIEAGSLPPIDTKFLRHSYDSSELPPADPKTVCQDLDEIDRILADGVKLVKT